MQVEKISRSQVLKNSVWKFFESIGSSGVHVLITILLARLLSPHDYGLMALVLVVISFMGLFINSGIASYLVYIKDVRKQDFLTVLLTNIIASLALLVVLIISSPKIADYYDSPSITNLLYGMAIVLPFNAVSSVYNAYAIKLSKFKTLFIRNMIAFPISGVVALVMAYYGFGVWALVAQQVISSILLAAIMVFTIKVDIDGIWKFETSHFFPMIRYGGYVLLTTIIAFISDNISDMLIGKRISPKQLGYYNRGGYYPNAFANIANNVLTGVLFPAFASYNSNIQELKGKFRKTVRMLYYIVFPLFLVLIACSKPLVLFTISDKWANSILVMQIICLYYLAIPFLQTGSQVLLATGHVKLRMTGEILKMIFTLVLLFWLVGYGIEAVAMSRVLVNALLVIYSIIMNKIIMNYGFREFLSDMSKPAIFGSIIFICIYPIIYLPFHPGIILVFQLLSGLVAFFVCLKIMNIEEMQEITNIVLKKVKLKS